MNRVWLYILIQRLLENITSRIIEQAMKRSIFEDADVKKNKFEKIYIFQEHNTELLFESNVFVAALQ